MQAIFDEYVFRRVDHVDIYLANDLVMRTSRERAIRCLNSGKAHKTTRMDKVAIPVTAAARAGREPGVLAFVQVEQYHHWATPFSPNQVLPFLSG